MTKARKITSLWARPLFTFACILSPALPATAQDAAVPPAEPKLIIAISVDQYSADLFEQYRDSYSGGLRQMADGVAYANGYQSHAATETCPGHSTILTGRHPAATGIVANTWFDVKSGSNIYCVGVPGTADPDAKGPQNLKVDTFGDWLKKARPGARSFAVSGKDRAAINMGGHHADGVYWWSDGKGFITSHYAGPATPAVTGPAKAFDDALFARWKAQPPALWPTRIPAQCQALAAPHMFGKLKVAGGVPPEASLGVEQKPDFLDSTDFQDQLRPSPLFDQTILAFATKVLDGNHLGRGPATDLLAISLSATDYVDHRYGSGGAEACTQTHMLDAALGQFLDHVKSLGIPYMVVLTADHGATDAAERAAEHGVDAHRIDGKAFGAALNKYLEQQLGLSYEPIVADDPMQLVINIPGNDAAFRTKLRDTAIAWIRQQPNVEAVFTREEVEAAVPPKGKPVTELSLAERFNESYDRDRSGDIAVAFRKYSTFGMPMSPGDNVAGHGSPWDHDRRVPILFWWPGVKADNRTQAIETVDIAPTLAGLVKIPTPQVDGHCINLAEGESDSCK